MGVLLVTGASRGIGADIARLAADRQWDVGVNFTADEASANSVAMAIRNQGGRATVVQADVSSPEQVESMFESVEQELGPVTGLVNCAGVATGIGTIDKLNLDETRRMFEVNVFGLYLCCRTAVKRMAKSLGGSGGVIVNVSSAAARSAAPGRFVDYAASKAAVDTLTIGLAKEQGPEGIRVYGVRPGIVNTDMIAAGAQKDPDWLPSRLAKIPTGRMGEVRDVSAAVLWLLSDEAAHATGTIVDISGALATQ